MNDTQNVDIVVSGGGSGNGITQIGEKTIDIGMSSRDVTAAEKTKYPGIVITTVANDAVAIIVHPTNTVANLTLRQIRDIYAGNVTNWKAVGGPDLPIVVIGRESASGTREFITSAVMGKTNYTKSMLEQNSNGGIKQSIASTPGAIGYVGLGYVDATVKSVPVNVNGTLFAATVPNVLNHSYPLSRGLYMITNGQPTGLAKDYIGFILSARGKEIVEEEGFVPLP
jgi:phosphate transport system substrate-binding protein